MLGNVVAKTAGNIYTHPSESEFVIISIVVTNESETEKSIVKIKLVDNSETYTLFADLMMPLDNRYIDSKIPIKKDQTIKTEILNPSADISIVIGYGGSD